MKFLRYSLLALPLLWASCSKKSDDTPVTPASPMEQPAAFGTPAYGVGAYPVTEAGFQLGKALFYDPALSADSTVSCANCHQPFAAFADLDHAVSHGINSAPGNRNSPTIQNLAWRNGVFMWDGRINHLESQPMAPIANAVEMGTDFAAIVRKVARLPRYKALTQAAYQSDTLTSQRFLKGLAQFMASLVSAHSRYDKYAGGDTTALTAQEKLGLRVFNAKGCNSCHKAPLFTDNSFRNNGIDDYSVDGGRFQFTRVEADRGKFLVPSLRNIAKTRPYMHDGRFNTLEEVVAQYRSGIQADANLDPSLTAGGIAMTDDEATALVAFLKTLTDDAFLTNPKFRP